MNEVVKTAMDKGTYMMDKKIDAEWLVELVADLRNKVERLEDDNKNLKCCGNCKPFEACNHRNEANLFEWNLCEHWESDGLTREERWA